MRSSDVSDLEKLFRTLNNTIIGESGIVGAAIAKELMMMWKLLNWSCFIDFVRFSQIFSGLIKNKNEPFKKRLKNEDSDFEISRSGPAGASFFLLYFRRGKISIFSSKNGRYENVKAGVAGSRYLRMCECSTAQRFSFRRISSLYSTFKNENL